MKKNNIHSPFPGVNKRHLQSELIWSSGYRSKLSSLFRCWAAVKVFYCFISVLTFFLCLNLWFQEFSDKRQFILCSISGYSVEVEGQWWLQWAACSGCYTQFSGKLNLCRKCLTAQEPTICDRVTELWLVDGFFVFCSRLSVKDSLYIILNTLTTDFFLSQ